MKKLKLFTFLAIFTLSAISVSAQLEWVTFDGEIPSYAVMGGVEHHVGLAICRCEYKGATHPGKVIKNGCNIGYGGKELHIEEFEILVNQGVVELDWLKVEGTLPAHAFQAGDENGTPLYVGRTHFEDGTHPGKVFKVGENYICNFGYDGKEITHTTYEVLVENRPDKNASQIRRDGPCDKKLLPTSCLGVYIGTMSKESQINERQSLVSNNLKYQTRVTDDGRLVVEEILERSICDDGRIVVYKAKEIWKNTKESRDESKDYYLKFQEDGNLCIYSEQDGFVWCSMSNGLNGHHLELTNIGHLEVVNHHGVEVWPD